MQVNLKTVKIFKINNRKGYGCICRNHLTEGKTIYEAYLRMKKALKRNGYILKDLTAKDTDRLLQSL